jgi:hypothetical protein
LAESAVIGKTVVGEPQMPPGSEDFPSGTASLPNGIDPLPEGMVVLPVGRAIIPTGSISLPAGSVTFPAGIASLPAGKMTIPAGMASLPVGRTTIPAGKASIPAGKTSQLVDIKPLANFRQFRQGRTPQMQPHQSRRNKKVTERRRKLARHVSVWFGEKMDNFLKGRRKFITEILRMLPPSRRDG